MVPKFLIGLSIKMKSVLCLTVLVALIALINGANVPMPDEQAKSVAFNEEMIAKIKEQFAMLNRASAQKLEKQPEPSFNENLFKNSLASLNFAPAQKVEAKPFNENVIASARQSIGERILKQRVNEVINKMKLRKAMMEQDKTQSNGLHFLCKPCKTVFTDVIAELESVEEITAPVLKEKIDEACKKFVGSIPFVEKSCDKIGETAVDDLLQWLLAEEDKINAERSCIFLHMC